MKKGFYLPFTNIFHEIPDKNEHVFKAHIDISKIPEEYMPQTAREHELLQKFMRSIDQEVEYTSLKRCEKAFLRMMFNEAGYVKDFVENLKYYVETASFPVGPQDRTMLIYRLRRIYSEVQEVKWILARMLDPADPRSARAKLCSTAEASSNSDAPSAEQEPAHQDEEPQSEDQETPPT